MNKMHNLVLKLNSSSTQILLLLLDASRGKGEGRIKCTVTRHRLAKTAILLGLKFFSQREDALDLITQWYPLTRSGPKKEGETRFKGTLVLECSSPQGLLEGVDQVWKQVGEAVSHRRVTTASLFLGLDLMNRLDPKVVRKLVSRACPVPRKYWDPELGQWL